jgi:hypothetical protein
VTSLLSANDVSSIKRSRTISLMYICIWLSLPSRFATVSISNNRQKTVRSCHGEQKASCHNMCLVPYRTVKYGTIAVSLPHPLITNLDIRNVVQLIRTETQDSCATLDEGLRLHQAYNTEVPRYCTAQKGVSNARDSTK